jgi:hypothetical protein
MSHSAALAIVMAVLVKATVTSIMLHVIHMSLRSSLAVNVMLDDRQRMFDSELQAGALIQPRKIGTYVAYDSPVAEFEF